MARRSIDIGLALAWAAANGFHVIWGSLTTWHTVGMPLRWLIEVQRRAWRDVVGSKTWRAWAEERGGNRVGYIRAAEITVGNHGWHPHFHPLIIVQGDRADAERYAAWMVKAWRAAVVKAGGRASGGKAQYLTVLEPGAAGEAVANYVTKARYTPAGLAMEAVWSQSKFGGRKGRVEATEAHWLLLQAAALSVEFEGLLWWEFEHATQGHRMIAWSRGLRAKAGLGKQTTDEAEAARNIGSAEDMVCYITQQGWRTVLRVPALQAGILDVLEQGGWAALRVYLADNGVEWVTGDELGVIQYARATNLPKQ